MKVINISLIVLFVLLIANIFAPYLIHDSITAGFFFLLFSMANRFVQPVAFGLCVYALFRKPSAGLIVFYCIYMLSVVLFFLQLLSWYRGMESMGPSMEE